MEAFAGAEATVRGTHQGWHRCWSGPFSRKVLPACHIDPCEATSTPVKGPTQGGVQIVTVTGGGVTTPAPLTRNGLVGWGPCQSSRVVASDDLRAQCRASGASGIRSSRRRWSQRYLARPLKSAFPSQPTSSSSLLRATPLSHLSCRTCLTRYRQQFPWANSYSASRPSPPATAKRPVSTPAAAVSTSTSRSRMQSLLARMRSASSALPTSAPSCMWRPAPMRALSTGRSTVLVRGGSPSWLVPHKRKAPFSRQREGALSVYMN